MIVKITRGGSAPGLMHYLVGPGQANEHESPHLVAASSGMMAWYSTDELGTTDAYRVGMLLEQPNREFGTEVTAPVKEFDRATGQLVPTGERKAAHMWHCSLSLAPDHSPVDDETWGAIAHDFIDEMGFSETSGKAPCRWVAVHHGASKNGGDHIHLAVNLVREDGTKASVHYDFKKAASAAAQLEAKYGLEVVDGRHVGRSARPESRRELAAVSEAEKAERAAAAAQGREPRPVETYSGRLSRTVRGCSAASSSEAEFVRRMRCEGLWVRPRFTAGSQDVIVGYSVAERPDHRTRAVWRAGGKLNKDLSLTRLRAGWVDSAAASEEAATEWRAAWRGQPIAASEAEPVDFDTQVWRQHSRQVAQLNKKLAQIPPEDHAAWAHVAHETSGVLAAWSLRQEQTPGPLAAASDELARTAALHTRVAHTPHRRKVSLRGPATTLLALAAAGPSSRTGQAIVLHQLVKVARAIQVSHAATSQARYAQNLARTLSRDLEQVAAGLPPVVDAPAKAPAAPPAPEREPGPALPNRIQRDRERSIGRRDSRGDLER